MLLHSDIRPPPLSRTPLPLNETNPTHFLITSAALSAQPLGPLLPPFAPSCVLFPACARSAVPCTQPQP